MKNLRFALTTSLLLASACSSKISEASINNDSTPSSTISVPNSDLASNTAVNNAEYLPEQFTEDKTNATGISSMRKELLDATATLDGNVITDVQALSQCGTIFKTKSKNVTIHWNHVGNFAATLDRGTATIPIDDGTGIHRFTLADGDNFHRVEGTMGDMAEGCGGIK